MPSFTGKGNQPHQGGNESEGRYRGQGSVMFTGVSPAFPSGLPRKEPLEERS